jgi:tetratricopeptide (TPR) repeat protein
MAPRVPESHLSIVLVLLIVTSAALYLEHGILTPIARDRSPEDEVRYWEEHVARNDHYAASRLRLGLAYEQVGRLADAQREVEKAHALDPDWEGAAIATYGVLVRRGQGERAFEGLERFTADHPGCSVCWQNLAAEYLGRKRLDDAKRAAEALLASRLVDHSGMYDVTDLKLEAYVMAGRVFAARGEHDRAIELFRRATRKNPRDVRGYVLESECLIAEGDYDAALAVLARAEERAESLDERQRRRITRLRRRARQARTAAR